MNQWILCDTECDFIGIMKNVMIMNEMADL